jgi:NhaC family Na+:H+ antiporter
MHTDGVVSLFAENFTLSPLLILPALVIVVLSLLRVNVKITMGISILLATALAVFLQDMPAGEVLRTFLTGYTPPAAELTPILSGGGILSMKQVFLIVCISSCYAGIFRETGLLDPLREKLRQLAEKATPFGSILLTSLITSLIACNQTLSIMLTHQLCEEAEPEPHRLAIDLENSVVVISPLIPWSIAGAVPLAAINAPTTSLVYAFYLYLLPIRSLLAAVYRKNSGSSPKEPQL